MTSLSWEYLNSDFRDTSNIFKDQHDFDLLMSSFVMLSIFWAINYWVIKYALDNSLRPKWYLQMEDKQKNAIVRMFNGNVHHILCFSIAVYHIIFQCEPLGLVRQVEECMRVYKPSHGHGIVLSFSYFLYDTVMLVVVNKDFSKLGCQTIFHHVLILVIYVTALNVGRYMPLLTQAAMVCEFS